mgnify:CR=1 FL=1|tara:strand:+ start:1356 stop:1637 length:282 start_codon:yes stop_codon:yes gene_type:complete
MTTKYKGIPYHWTNQVKLRTGKMLTVGYTLGHHVQGAKKFYALYQHVGIPLQDGTHNLNWSGENFQAKEFPQVYNKPLLLEYMKMQGYKEAIL